VPPLAQCSQDAGRQIVDLEFVHAPQIDIQIMTSSQANWVSDPTTRPTSAGYCA
jgi:hypothetical protein